MEELIIRVLRGEATPGETERVEEWRIAAPENEAYYRYLDALWSARRFAPPAAAGEGVPSSFEIIRRARERKRSAGAVSAGPHWRRWVASAAAVVLLVVGFSLSTFQSPAPLFAGVVSTSATEVATLTLGDGTVVRIGPKSNLRFPQDADRREVWLDGEAFFSVAAVKDRPFVVHTPTGTATALSTRFRVKTELEGMRVGVLQGRVAVATGGVEREVDSGEIGEVASGKLTVERAASVEELRPHLGAFLAFRSTPLWMVADEVADLYGVKVEVESGEVGGRTVTASFQDASFQELMSVVCRITAARCSIADSVVVVGDGRRP